MISPKALKKFKEIYKKRFKVELSDQDALEKATKLSSLVKIVYKPMTADEYKRLQKRRKEMGET